GPQPLSRTGPPPWGSSEYPTGLGRAAERRPLGPMTAMSQVTSFGSRSVNGGNGAEATDQDFVVYVRFPVCGDQKQTVGFRPISVTPGRMHESPLLALLRSAESVSEGLLIGETYA